MNIRGVIAAALVVAFIFGSEVHAYPITSEATHMIEMAKKSARKVLKEEKPKDLYGNEIDLNNTWGKSSWTGEMLTAKKGIIFANGKYYTFYNQPMEGCYRLHGEEIAPYGLEHYWVDSRGIKMCGPYVMCAAYTPWFPAGTLVDTPFGKGIVIDYNGHCDLPGGTKADIDICVTWGKVVPN